MAQPHHVRLAGDQQVQRLFQLLFQRFPAQMFPYHAVVLRQQHVIRVQCSDSRSQGSDESALHAGGHGGNTTDAGRMLHFAPPFRINDACGIQIVQQSGPFI